MSIFDELAATFARRCHDILGENLVGAYLHGSLAMGCFNPAKSDIDLIIVTEREPEAEAKRRLMEMALALDEAGPGKGIEFSVVCREVCDPFIYPTPFTLHYSRMHTVWYRKDPDDYLAKMNGVDPDLAAHFTILRHRGKALYGKPVKEVFGEVPREAYLDSIVKDVENAREDILGDPVYAALNLCRVLAFASDGVVLSKREGGEWGMDRLPEEYRGVVSGALAAYNSDAAMPLNEPTAARFAAYMLQEIKKRV